MACKGHGMYDRDLGKWWWRGSMWGSMYEWRTQNELQGRAQGVRHCLECCCGLRSVSGLTGRPKGPAIPPPHCSSWGAHQEPVLPRLSALLNSPPSPSAVSPGSQSTVLKWTWKIKTEHELAQYSRTTLRSQVCHWPELGDFSLVNWRMRSLVPYQKGITSETWHASVCTRVTIPLLLTLSLPLAYPHGEL
jgi:hypothetical protein